MLGDAFEKLGTKLRLHKHSDGGAVEGVKSVGGGSSGRFGE
jgi:hypothetical protein